MTINNERYGGSNYFNYVLRLNNIHCNFVQCVTSGEGFERGQIYPQLGWNNGIGIQRVNEAGDCETFLCCTGGIGKGLFNNFDGSGSPSFNEVTMDYFLGYIDAIKSLTDQELLQEKSDE